MKPYYDADGIQIFHGDCREILPTLEFDVIVTDPPYGAAFDSGWTDRGQIQGDATAEVRDEILSSWDGAAVVFGKWSIERPPRVRMTLIWDKGDWPGMGDLAFPWGCSHEEVYIIGDGFVGPRAGTVLRDPRRPSGKALHQNEKPLELMQRLIARCPDGVVTDPFMGSGTTLVAARDCGRRAIGIEIEEKYCEIAANRLAQGVLDFG